MLVYQLDRGRKEFMQGSVKSKVRRCVLYMPGPCAQMPEWCIWQGWETKWAECHLDTLTLTAGPCR